MILNYPQQFKNDYSKIIFIDAFQEKYMDAWGLEAEEVDRLGVMNFGYSWAKSYSCDWES